MIVRDLVRVVDSKTLLRFYKDKRELYIIANNDNTTHSYTIEEVLKDSKILDKKINVIDVTSKNLLLVFIKKGAHYENN